MPEGPTAEQERDHLAEQCTTLLRENERLRAALRTVTEFAADYAGGVNSDLGDVEDWEPMKMARAALGKKD